MEYHIDAILNEVDRFTLAYHLTFNPTENIWSIGKGHVAKRNISLSMQSIKYI